MCTGSLEQISWACGELYIRDVQRKTSCTGPHLCEVKDRGLILNYVREPRWK